MGLVRFVMSHPLNRAHRAAALSRVLSWQLRSRLSSGKLLVPFVNDAKLLVGHGMTGATGNIYCGLHEVHEMGLVLHLLRPGDLFVDVGANVGSYTVLAGAVAGADVICFEPSPTTFLHLKDNLALNELDGRCDARLVAVGAESGTVRFAIGLDTTDHVATVSDSGESVAVEVVRLDDALAGRAPLALKIDVEGFETSVVAGARATLRAPSLLVVVMEMAGAGAHYGHDEAKLHQEMVSFGFTPYAYDAVARTFRPGSLAGGNMVYVRDLEAVRARIVGAPRFRLPNGEI